MKVTQKKLLLARAQSECLLSSNNGGSHQQQMHIPKQEPSDFVCDYQPTSDKRASWDPSSNHHIGY